MASNWLKIVAVVLFALVGVAALTNSFAAPSGGKGGSKPSGGTSSIKLVTIDSTDGLPHYGQKVTFTVSTSATDQPFVQLNCYENNVWVLSSSAGFFDSYPWPWNRNFTLSWDNYHTAGAAADCTAKLYSQSSSKNSTLATTSFRVYP